MRISPWSSNESRACLTEWFELVSWSPYGTSPKFTVKQGLCGYNGNSAFINTLICILENKALKSLMHCIYLSMGFKFAKKIKKKKQTTYLAL